MYNLNGVVNGIWTSLFHVANLLPVVVGAAPARRLQAGGRVGFIQSGRV